MSADVNVTLSEKTGIRLTIAQAILAVGALASIVSAGVVAWQSEKSAREAHERNIYIHLDPQFTQEHGLPVGKWDMSNRDEKAAAAWKAYRDEMDKMARRQDAFESELDRRRPKWHP